MERPFGKSHTNINRAEGHMKMRDVVLSFQCQKTAGMIAVTEKNRIPAQKTAGMTRGRMRGNDSKGFTLVEVLIGLALAAIVMSAIYSLYLIFYKQSSCQYLKLEAQQNSRAALEMMQKDLLMAGHRVASGDTPIVAASDTSVTFRYIDPADSNKIEVTYELSGANIRKVRCVRTTAWTDACSMTFPNTTDWVLVMDNLNTAVASPLEFNYYTSSGGSPTGLGDIRFVKVTVDALAREACAGQTAKDNVKVWTEVRLRNLETESGQADTTPPSAVTWLKAREATTSTGRAGVCGSLTLQWAESTAEDLASYRIMYTLAGVERSVNVPVSSTTEPVSGTLQYTLSPTDATGWLLQPTKSTELGSPKTYVIGIRAVDTSNNASTLTEIPGGNPDPSNTDFASGVDDTTINPSRPQGAVGFTTALTGVDGSSDGWVNLSWTYDTAANPDVIGYRVYRNTSNFTAYPVSSALAIAAETDVYGAANKLIASSATHTDKSSGLVGCQTYYYSITPVNCDDTLVAGNTSTDYKITYGDGVATAAVDSPTNNVSDTAPPDTVGIGGRAGDTSPYPYPALSANAGWKRVKLNLTNPNITGIHNPPSSYSDPDFNHTYIAFKRWPSGAGVCDAATTCAVNCCYPGNISNSGVLTDPDAAGVAAPPSVSISLLPDHDPSVAQAGKFTDAGSGGDNSFFFDSETQLSATPPTLENVCATFTDPNNPCTYYFKAISFDRCGNASNITAFAQPLSTLCGDDPDYPGSPGVPVGLTIGGCTSAQVSWDDTLSGIIDFAGYTVERDTDSDVAGATALSGKTLYSLPLPAGDVYWYDQYWPNSASCPWGCNKPYWEDSTVTQGVDYYYFIRSMDCAYANDPLGDSSSPADGNNIDFPGNISGAVWAGPKSFGKIDRDSKCEDTVAPVDLVCGNNDASNKHREVLTGVEINTGAGSGNGTSSPLPWTTAKINYTHNSTTLFLNNTSGRTMTITGATVGWVNTDAYLTNISIGGGRSSGSAISNAVPLSRASAASPQSYTTTVTLGAPVQIAASDRYVPIIFTFKDSSGNPVDMRSDEIKVSLVVTNDSTLTSTCGSFLTVSESEGSVVVPLGPTITSVQQNQPSSGTPGYAVPGSTGLNTTSPNIGALYTSRMSNAVIGGATVRVSADIASNTVSEDTGSAINVNSAKVYYASTSYATTAPPTDFSSYAELSMFKTSDDSSCLGFSSTTRCYATIPSHSELRVWYFIRAIDADGNFDASPEPFVTSVNTYVYDQKPFDPCDLTPSTPASLSVATVTADHAAIKWPRITTYTTGGTITKATDPIYYQVWRRSSIGGAYTKIYEVPDIDKLDWGASVTNVLPSSSAYFICNNTAPTNPTYNAQNTCYWWNYYSTAGSTLSDLDVTYYVKAENSCGNDVLADDDNSSAETNTYRECVGAATAVITVSPSSIVAGSSYTALVSDCGNAGGALTVTNKADTGNILYNAFVTEGTTNTLNTTTDIGQSASKVYVSSGSTGDLIRVNCPACTGPPAEVTVTVTQNPCDSTPSIPGNFCTGGATACSTSGQNMTLRWNAVTTNTDASSITDLAGYEIWERAVKNDNSTDTGWYLRTTAGTGSGVRSITVDSDRGAVSQYRYYFKIRAYDTCGTPNTSGYTAEWAE